MGLYGGGDFVFVFLFVLELLGGGNVWFIIVCNDCRNIWLEYVKVLIVVDDRYGINVDWYKYEDGRN